MFLSRRAWLGCGLFFCFSASQAATVELGFSGVLGILPVAERNSVNFLGAREGELVSGRFIFDLALGPEDLTSGSSELINFSSGASFSREFGWSRVEFDQAGFDFSFTQDSGLDKDVFRLDLGGDRDELAITEAYNERRTIRCDGLGNSYCWGVRLNAQLPKGTLSLEWPQAILLDAEDLRDSMFTFNLFNNNVDYGAIGFQAGFIDLQSLTMNAPAPVPLPAGGWLFLTALISGGLFARRRKILAEQAQQ